MTQTYERVLITNIWDTKENGLSQIPVFTEEEYMKQLKIQDKSHGGLCELVGLKEYQQGINNLNKDLLSLKTYFQKNKVTFTNKEYGYIFLNII